ncbi:hypothetical protein F0562_006861 [Nyssa sinensis]|uniref:Uncharacterized protein n=1 Tax=Nyssa sinensis TaxID=561372 RepID=A0A5J5ARJ2_9ASTE|nr:hypothetical protein F0562_006861 [Nyssa sinensis]
MGELGKPFSEPENKTRRRSQSPEKGGEKWTELLPDSKDFEEAIIASVLGSSNENGKVVETGIFQRKIDKRLKVGDELFLLNSYSIPIEGRRNAARH